MITVLMNAIVYMMVAIGVVFIIWVLMEVYDEYKYDQDIKQCLKKEMDKVNKKELDGSK
jgi:hypothetical protein